MTSMITALLTATIPALALIIVQIIISAKQQRVQDVKFDMTIKQIREDIARLESKQDKHNQLIERVTRLEVSDESQWIDINHIKDK